MSTNARIIVVDMADDVGFSMRIDRGSLAVSPQKMRFVGQKTGFLDRPEARLAIEPLFDSADPLRSHGLQRQAGRIVAHQSYEHGRSAKRGDIGGNIAGAADRGILILNMQHQNRSLRRDPADVTANIMVEHHVSDDEYPACPKAINVHDRLPL
ncbi:hypothetical protein SAMN03159496_00375 [Rhizobium sp. NFR07]|nr:hypothetical protein SAMN03159496_00375 [Rhizobium sp. NFR07]